ncbi:hypothetical protein, partial [Kitasatospora sp. NPDC056531]|uniref:hypothetical protein n=1 Tax=Kitasatospora sp. NPDC056531 TaxID=3345856 RepID=UPI0036A2D2C5
MSAPGPGALDILTKTDGTLTTALRLGVSPGMVKFEGSRPMTEIAELIADDANPARHIKTGGVVSADESPRGPPTPTGRTPPTPLSDSPPP